MNLPLITLINAKISKRTLEIKLKSGKQLNKMKDLKLRWKKAPFIIFAMS